MNVRLGDDAESLAARLKARRLELRLGQAETARRASVSRMTWYEWENGRRAPRDYNFAGIDEAMEWEPGGVEAILAGGDPTPAQGRRQPTKAELRALLIARLAAVEAQYPEIHDMAEAKRHELIKRTVDAIPDDRVRDLLDNE